MIENDLTQGYGLLIINTIIVTLITNNITSSVTQLSEIVTLIKTFGSNNILQSILLCF